MLYMIEILNINLSALATKAQWHTVIGRTIIWFIGHVRILFYFKCLKELGESIHSEYTIHSNNQLTKVHNVMKNSGL